MKRRRTPTGFSPEVKTIIKDRAQSRCERCGGNYSDCVAHHRRPRGSGGSKRLDTNQPSNGVWLCGSCHRIVESSRDQAFEDGFLVRQGHSPLKEPLEYRKYSEDPCDPIGSVVLDDGGSVLPAPPPRIELAK